MTGERIKYYRELRQYKSEWLANKLGISDSQLNRIENGITPITLQRLHSIAELLEVTILDLIEEKYLSLAGSINPDKYGPVASSFIRYLIVQNEMLQKENTAQLKRNTELQEQLLLLTSRLNNILNNTLMNTKTSATGGG